jgi:hypothetical protein
MQVAALVLGMAITSREVSAPARSIAARQLPDQLVLALALQRLDTACGTAQEFGFNLYATAEQE